MTAGQEIASQLKRKRNWIRLRKRKKEEEIADTTFNKNYKTKKGNLKNKVGKNIFFLLHPSVYLPMLQPPPHQKATHTHTYTIF
jgi:hypothetical protein